MKTILDDIVARKKIEVAEAMEARPLAELEAKLADMLTSAGLVDVTCVS